jgi:hypothetical protein
MPAAFALTAGKPIQCQAAVAWAANKPLSNETIIVVGYLNPKP